MPPRCGVPLQVWPCNGSAISADTAATDASGTIRRVHRIMLDSSAGGWLAWSLTLEDERVRHGRELHAFDDDRDRRHDRKGRRWAERARGQPHRRLRGLAQ